MSVRTREQQRLAEARDQKLPWKKWGPYLSERQWGSVREKTNTQVEAWNDVTHDQSRSRAYQSGEDGIAGFCDENMLICFSLGMWNRKGSLEAGKDCDLAIWDIERPAELVYRIGFTPLHQRLWRGQ